MIDNYSMRSFFDENVTGLIISLLQFDKCLQDHAPDISNHLVPLLPLLPLLLPLLSPLLLPLFKFLKLLLLSIHLIK
jgi:hypothetical protein